MGCRRIYRSLYALEGKDIWRRGITYEYLVQTMVTAIPSLLLGILFLFPVLWLNVAGAGAALA